MTELEYTQTTLGAECDIARRTMNNYCNGRGKAPKLLILYLQEVKLRRNGIMSHKGAPRRPRKRSAI